MKHRRMDWVECVVISIGVHGVSLTILANLSLLCVTYAHVHVLYARNTMEQNNNNTVQVVAHAMTYTCDKYVLPGIQHNAA